MSTDPLVSIRSVYPFRSNYLTIDGHRLHYLDEGQGPPLLLLHGNPTWSFYYRRLVMAFRDRFRVIVPDHMGCGLSDKPRNYPYCLRQHIANTEQLIHHLDLRNITLGVHDWGGAIGFGVATREPMRFDRFIVFNTAAFHGPVPFRIAICRTPILGTLVVRGLNGFLRPALSMATCNKEVWNATMRAGYLLPYRSYANRIAIDRFVRDIPTTPSHPSWDVIEQISHRLAGLRRHPMRILWGAKDFCFHRGFLESWQMRFPDAQVSVFDSAGHWVVEDAHAEIMYELRKFLNC